MRSEMQLVSQGILRIPHPSTQHPSPPPSYKSTPSNLPPPFNMANTMKMVIFKGVGSEDLEKLWFVADVVWIVQQITDDNIKKAQLVTTLQDKVLTWYIKYCEDHPVTTLEDTHQALNREFKNPKS